MPNKSILVVQPLPEITFYFIQTITVTQLYKIEIEKKHNFHKLQCSIQIHLELFSYTQTTEKACHQFKSIQSSRSQAQRILFKQHAKTPNITMFSPRRLHTGDKANTSK